MIKSTPELLSILSLILLISCDRYDPPVVSEPWVMELISTRVLLSGYVLSDGGSSVTSRGVCWSISENPSISGSKTTEGSGLGSFSTEIRELMPLTKYYVRSYAQNRAGTGYSKVTSFTTGRYEVRLSTQNITSITDNTAVSGGEVTAETGAIITARGVCWGKTMPPTLADNKTADGTGPGKFSSNITGLEPGTTYYVASYATCNGFTDYGWGETFKTYDGSLTDADLNVYYSIKVGNQEWMSSNLKGTKYNNGEVIGTTTPATLDIQAVDNPGYQWPSAGNENNVNGFGRLYTWYAAIDSRKLCPAGWHLPSDEEWSVMAAGMTGNDAARFNSKPAGYRLSNGIFSQFEETSRWWSSTDYSATEAFGRYCEDINAAPVRTSSSSMKDGLSVRCIRD